MVDLNAYRARIGAFASCFIRLRKDRGAVRKEKRKKKNRRSCNTVAAMFAILAVMTAFVFLTTLCLDTVSANQAVPSHGCSLMVVQCLGTKAWVTTFAVRDFLIGNHGAHMYNGNPPTTSRQPKKRQKTTTANQSILTAFAFGKNSKDREPEQDPVQSEQISTTTRQVNAETETVCDTGTTEPKDPIELTDDAEDSTPKKSAAPQITKSSKRYFNKYNLNWFESNPCLKSWCSRSVKGLTFAHCTICNKDLSVATGGMKDLLKHQDSNLHNDNLKSQKSKPIQAHFQSSESSFENLVTQAEVLWSNFVVEHQLSFRVCDHASKLFANMFPDSKIAKKFKCSRTKARNIIVNSVAPAMHDSVTNILKTNHFSLLTDDTTDAATKQQCCILVRYFDESCGIVRGLFYKVLNLSSATSETIYNGILKVFNSENVPVGNILALGTDGAATMIGQIKGLYGRFKKVQSNIYSVWCICHRIHIVAKKSVSCMPKDIHELPVELFYWFKKSSKRCEAYEKMQSFCDVVHHKLLKPSDTRWLSMQQISDRLSEQWIPLQSHFNSLPTDYEINKNGQKSKKVDKLTREKIMKIRQMLNSDVNRLCFLFMKEYLKKFTVFNCFFQTSKPMAYLIVPKLKHLLKDILSCFVNASAINLCKPDLRNVNIANTENLLDPADMWFGDAMIFEIFSQLTDNGKDCEVKKFQDIVLCTYRSSFKELSKLPFDDPVLVNLCALNPGWQGDISVRSMFMSLVKLFPHVLTSDDHCKLDSELRLYDTFDMPQSISSLTDVCTYWWKVGKLRDEADVILFPSLYKLVKALLVIPHGNAESEQIFSRLKLMKTKFKTWMTGKTLNAVLTVNFNSDTDCYQYKPSGDVLKSVKTACNVKTSLEFSEDDLSDFEEVAPVKRSRKPNKKYADYVPE